jgi:immunity protein, SdpI family
MTNPIRTSWWTEGPQWLLLLAMFALGAWTWSTAPERVPVHWNAAGEVDRYGGKPEGLFMLPAVALGVYLLLLLLPRLDPGRANYATFAGAYNVIRLTMLAFFAALYGWTVLEMRGRTTLNAEVVMAFLTGLLFIVLGGVMGKIRPNWFVGVRTPWTLSSKRSWVKTHRLAGWLFVLAGLTVWACFIASPGWMGQAIMVAAALAAGVPAAYSYFVWRTDPDKVPPALTLPLDDRR